MEAALSFMAALATVHLALWLAIVSLRLAVDADLHPSDAVLAFLIAVAGCILAGRSQAAIRATAIIGSALLLATWGVALIYAAALDSLSYDGQTYHALAIRHLRDGWNPFRDQLTPNVPPMTWLNHYPKASWIWATGIEAMVGSYQAGKATNLVLAIAAGAAVFSAASAVVHAPKWACFLFGALAAANPVASVQMAEYYVDGLLGSLLTIMAAGALIWTRRQSPLALLMICAAAICLVNVKFTGLVYALLLGSVVFAVSLLRRRTRLAGALPVLACLLAVVGPGYNPYVTNMLDGDHIFHPVMGDRQIDILGISDSTPSPLDGYPAAAQLALSLASETANSCRKCDPGRLKPPFVVRESEIRGATIPDPRTGGFGPLFSAALLLAAILLVVSMRAGAASMTLGISLVVLVGLVMVNPAAWWARYVPHLWLIPLTIAAFLHRAELGPIGRVARIALLVVLVANAGFMAVIASGYAAYSTLEARAQVANLARSGPVYVAASPWAGALQRLHDGGVAVAEREFGQPDCQEVVTVLRSDLDVCVPVAP
ncbi:MAG TPA: hypothetical protein VGN82_02960 [Bosea sp. (in: a-proteobacteria)]|uniref:hypothetical protein n=1 Tax=Bosea sp. (in: a-proteobacteria) TaxID=1871050 RepID=UPI002E0F0E87|nr:hypothetical protein [Bosea sp. (in: a-proteobacteria)]